MDASVGSISLISLDKIKHMTMTYYYLVCFVYSIVMSSITWRKNGGEGGLGITPGLDVLVISLLCWALAPVDLSIRMLRVIEKAEEHRIRRRSIC
jgi:hypothetical protein